MTYKTILNPKLLVQHSLSTWCRSCHSHSLYPYRSWTSRCQHGSSMSWCSVRSLRSHSSRCHSSVRRGSRWRSFVPSRTSFWRSRSGSFLNKIRSSSVRSRSFSPTTGMTRSFSFRFRCFVPTVPPWGCFIMPRGFSTWSSRSRCCVPYTGRLAWRSSRCFAALMPRRFIPTNIRRCFLIFVILIVYKALTCFSNLHLLPTQV